MQPTNLFIFLSALRATTALALPQKRAQPGPGPWYINNYNPGCGTSPAGCEYSFNVSYAPAYGSLEPALCTSCLGSNIQGGYKPCVDTSVSFNEVCRFQVPGFMNDTLFLQHVYTADGATYTVTGNVTVTDFERVGQSFVVVPSVITAIA
ncbi:hypothetical protein D0Z07_4288 [Hyphodiscus hymeniophilus]|uniref:Uncharacterized protein n=1 Tax=Hyphodiscus hymeniophilus TaxID=353542 RepID=A0A9P7AXK7_9HELO|nr:hypothetical protein D0Z07_4288 [Hyphodiscus hymeniophilus]